MLVAALTFAAHVNKHKQQNDTEAKISVKRFITLSLYAMNQ
jgi:hypothetical protein